MDELKLDTIDEQINAYLGYCRDVLSQADSTMDSKTYILRRFAYQTKIKDMREVDNRLIDWWVGLQRTSPGHEWVAELAGSTIEKRVRLLRMLIDWLTGLGLDIPAKTSLLPKIKTTKTPRVWYTAAQIEQALEHANGQQHLMIKLKFDAGLRLGELRLLKAGAIKEREFMVFGKGSKWRKVCISPETLIDLLIYVRQKGLSDDDYLWPQIRRPKGQRRNLKCAISKKTLSSALAQPFIKAGFNDFHPHALRHSFATHLQLNSTPTEVIKELMGHDDIRTTEAYLHAFELGKLTEYDRYWRPVGGQKNSVILDEMAKNY